MYKENNVFDEALRRIRFLFDTHDDIIVSMSGGKDSTVLFNLALKVAKEKNRLPLKVFWLDQEVEWQHTVDYMESIMRMPEVKPYWFQIPFDFTNSLSNKNNFIRLWDEQKKELWVHPQSDISIKTNPCKENRFHELTKWLPEYCTESDNCAVLVGMRISESFNRRTTILFGKTSFMGETWCKRKVKKTQVFWPIYDFQNSDIWTAIGKNHWNYNKVYDLMYRWGYPSNEMRVSALIHETAWHSIELLQEFEKTTYNKMIARVPGVSAFNHTFDSTSIVPHQLPFMFKDWKEYRDYLLVHIVKPEYWDLFRRRWTNQNDEEWYKTHVQECVLNDIDGTINANMASKKRLQHKKENNKFGKENDRLFTEWLKEKRRVENGN